MQKNEATGLGLGGLVVLIIIGVWAYNTYIKQNWTAIFYPNASDLSTAQQQHNLDSLDACRNWIQQQASVNNNQNYDYECGKNCHPGTGSVDVCDETVR